MPTCFLGTNRCRGLSLLLITVGKGLSGPLQPDRCFRGGPLGRVLELVVVVVAVANR